MKNFARSFALCLAASSICILPARADDCAPLKKITSVDMITGPQAQRIMVPVTINGTPRKMLLDTGGYTTQVTPETVADLKIESRDSHIKLLGGGGNASNQQVLLDSFQLGIMQATGIHVQVSPNPGSEPYDGVLAGDLMFLYDVDMDFAGRKLTYFSPDHCDGHVVYWVTGNEPIAVVPVILKSQKIRIPVTLDGKDLSAEIDTGRPTSAMIAPVADRAFGLTEASPGNVPLGTMQGKKVFGHIFKTLTIGGITVNNPHVVIQPDLMGSHDVNNTFQTGSMIRREDDKIDRAELNIGMDVLKRLHVYMAFKEGKIYVTANAAAGPPATPVSDQQPAP